MVIMTNYNGYDKNTDIVNMWVQIPVIQISFDLDQYCNLKVKA
jgi:hypothetical protein